ncbi:MAG: HAD family hydrolase [Oscillospiraceae bacterium]|jgi:Cof subfamily protein (haloacid dehalogenase superfamily)|nr:HAD family hydrolase [Oscillospiraceae bacterium]
MSKVFDGVLLVSDIDGTLISRDYKVHPKNLEAIEVFKRQGGLFTVATGRSYEAARPYALAAGVNCPAIVYNGGGLYDFDKQQTVWQSFLPKEANAALLKATAAFPEAGAEIHAQGVVYLLQSSPEAQKHIDDEGLTVIPCTPDSLPESGWNKILFAANPEILKRLKAFSDENSVPGAYYIFTSRIYFELIPAGADKGMALVKLAELCGSCREKICAVGDYYNDIPLIREAAISAYAANAPEDLKAVAQYVAADCDEGTVADFIAHIKTILGGK